MEKKIMAKSLTLLVTVASLSVVLLVGVSIAAAALSPNHYKSGSSYKQTTCLDKVLEFSLKGIIRDVGGFNGGLFECSQIQWAGSIYGVVAK
jgi:hypothetical protein